MLLRIPRDTTVQQEFVCQGLKSLSFIPSEQLCPYLLCLVGSCIHSPILYEKNWTTHYLLYHCIMMNFDFDQPVFQKEREYKNCLFKARMETINKSFCWEIILLNWLRTYYVHIQGDLTIQFSALYNLCNKEKIATV